MSIVERLTEGIVNRDLSTEGAALISKWEQTGLLEGISDDTQRNGMARLLENQAKELLRESSSMAGGDVEGFAAVAFPLVRRVFGSLIANDLVSVQPMSLPSGLIFFLDFTFGGILNNTADRLGNPFDTSLYGGGRVAAQITGGVLLDGVNAERGPYALNNGYSSPTGSITIATTLVASGNVGEQGGFEVLADTVAAAAYPNLRKSDLLDFDPDLVSGSAIAAAIINKSALTTGQFNFEDYVAITVAPGAAGDLADGRLVRRLTREDPTNEDRVLLIVNASGSETAAELATALNGVTTCTAPIVDNFVDGGPLGSVIGQTNWGLENNEEIPEIDIKVDSVAVTAVTKKLKAKWTPELGQDLNAYHNLDAEVELTQILSEQIALEIDREILEDLVRGATAGTRYWSRNPGRFLNRLTGEILASGTADFTGNVSEWYETLVETINEVSAEIHRKTLRGAANFVVCGPEVANILEFTAGFRANVTADADRGDIGAVKVGALSKKFDVIVDPYFPRQLILVGRRGSSFLESGYVYAPYVPLQTTPTIFGVEDFVPRKGVMTRYAKKMVRPDLYGLVICRDLVVNPTS
tara:strand:- start:15989 stop:17737 length:1749 start_codon:yes stop_codon:yes gene_type:complete